MPNKEQLKSTEMDYECMKAEVEYLNQRTKELNDSNISVTCFKDSKGMKRHYLTKIKNQITFYSKEELFVHNREPTDQQLQSTEDNDPDNKEVVGCNFGVDATKQSKEDDSNTE